MYKTPNKYYEDNHKENSKLSFKAFQKRSEFWQGVLVASASLYGILVSLHDNFQEPLCTRVVFLCLIVVLTIGVSAAATVLFNFSQKSFTSSSQNQSYGSGSGRIIQCGHCTHFFISLIFVLPILYINFN